MPGAGSGALRLGVSRVVDRLTSSSRFVGSSVSIDRFKMKIESSEWRAEAERVTGTQGSALREFVGDPRSKGRSEIVEVSGYRRSRGRRRCGAPAAILPGVCSSSAPGLIQPGIECPYLVVGNARIVGERRFGVAVASERRRSAEQRFNLTRCPF